jgi:hypothetical protein
VCALSPSLSLSLSLYRSLSLSHNNYICTLVGSIIRRSMPIVTNSQTLILFSHSVSLSLKDYDCCRRWRSTIDICRTSFAKNKRSSRSSVSRARPTISFKSNTPIIQHSCVLTFSVFFFSFVRYAVRALLAFVANDHKNKEQVATLLLLLFFFYTKSIYPTLHRHANLERFRL